MINPKPYAGLCRYYLGAPNIHYQGAVQKGFIEDTWRCPGKVSGNGTVFVIYGALDGRNPSRKTHAEPKHGVICPMLVSMA